MLNKKNDIDNIYFIIYIVVVIKIYIYCYLK